MFFELVATFAAGIGAAGLVLLLNRLSGGRFPGWVMPVAAGLTMIGYTIWSEYSWASRTAGSLPDGVVVVQEVGESRAWKPWTYVAPNVTRLMALDRNSIQTKPDAPDTRLVDLYLFARWQPTSKVPQLVRCSDGARADVTDAALANPDAATWIALGPDDPLVRESCKASG